VYDKLLAQAADGLFIIPMTLEKMNCDMPSFWGDVLVFHFNLAPRSIDSSPRRLANRGWLKNLYQWIREGQWACSICASTLADFSHNPTHERLIKKGAGELDQSFLTLRPDEAVAKVFDPMKPARDTLDRLAKVLEPMGQLAQLADVFEPIRKFQEELADVAAAFEPIKGFRGHLENLANRFEPMRAFQSQLEGVAAAFHDQLVKLATAMEPATAFQDQLQHLVRAFEPANSLQHRFVELSRAFGGEDEGDTSAVRASSRPRSRPPRDNA